MEALAEGGSELAFLRNSLLQIGLYAGADAVWLFRTDEDGLMRLVGSSHGGRFSAEGEPDDPPSFRSGVRPVAGGWEAVLPNRRLVWRSLDEPVDPGLYNSSTLAWHRAQSHRANALVGLMSGDELIGLVGMVFRHPQRPNERQQELLRALSQPLALALKLMRLGVGGTASCRAGRGTRRTKPPGARDS